MATRPRGDARSSERRRNSRDFNVCSKVSDSEAKRAADSPLFKSPLLEHPVKPGRVKVKARHRQRERAREKDKDKGAAGDKVKAMPVMANRKETETDEANRLDEARAAGATRPV